VFVDESGCSKVAAATGGLTWGRWLLLVDLERWIVLGKNGEAFSSGESGLVGPDKSTSRRELRSVVVCETMLEILSAASLAEWFWRVTGSV